MKYKPLTSVIIVLAILFMAFDSNVFLKTKVLHFGDKIKIWFFDAKEGVKLSYAKYVEQAQNIEKYEKQARDYSKLKLEFQDLKTQYERLSEFVGEVGSHKSPVFIPAKAFSYVGIGDYDRIWLDADVSSYPPTKIFGIVQDDYALGIAAIKNNRLMGLLNGDENSSYAVYVGDEKIPAIIRYDPSDPQKILADFIPSWRKVNIGDAVVTSGLDGVFIPNVKVGKVSDVIQNYGYVTAEVSPYAKKNHLEYVWLVDTQKPQTKLDFNQKDTDK